MPSNVSHENARSRPGRGFSGFLVILLVAALGAVGAGPFSPHANASEKPAKDSESVNAANAMALPNTYRFELTYRDRDEALQFSTVTAMRHFSLAPPERHIRFRGRLWLQPDGRELLDFSVELGQQIAQKDGGTAVSSHGQWSGSAYLQSGEPIKIVENPNSTITVSLTRQ